MYNVIKVSFLTKFAFNRVDQLILDKYKNKNRVLLKVYIEI